MAEPRSASRCSNGYGDHEFLVVENPVRHPLETEGLVIESPQEYVCRAWENPDWALQHVEDRTLERWLYYAAAEQDIVKALYYLRWQAGLYGRRRAWRDAGLAADQVSRADSAPQSGRLLARIPDFDQPQWRILPRC